MIVLETTGWDEYELIDSGDGKRLERFGSYTIIRPDPQILWRPKLSREWEKADAIFEQKEKGGSWVKKNTKMPDSWLMRYKNISFFAKLTPFKHTGVFPEQVLQWEWIDGQIKKRKNNSQIRILNLFGYTGIASLVCSLSGATVTHVDASYPTIGWARENQKASQLLDKPIRWIQDDAIKFVEREIKRRNLYEGIIMDPPIYGHGPQGETWNFHESFPKLLNLCSKVLSSDPLFVIVNAYAISASALMLENVFQDFFGNLNGTIKSGELALSEKTGKRLLSTGIFGRWCSSNTS
jgi:23S rRNA (cytosine1962-C5)-methyltransferase